MPIAEEALKRDFILVNESTTVGEVRDRVAATENKFTYVIVRLDSGQYAVLWLADLIRALQTESDVLLPDMLETPLHYVPDLLAPRAGDAVEQSSMGTGRAERLCRKMPGKRLVVLAEGEVVGLLTMETRKVPMGLDLDWLDQPLPDAEVHVSARPERPVPKGEPRTLAEEAEEAMEEMPPFSLTPPEPEKRWINAEIRDHDKDQPLHMGESYELAFDVDTELRETAVGGAGLAEEGLFRGDEQLVELTVQLASEDFDIYTESQKLRVPRTGRSKNKARFDIEPRHEGEGIINAVFLKEGNFIQLLTLKLFTGAPGQRGVLATESLGRPVEAAFAVQPRDLNLTILEAVGGFQVIMSGPVAATATLPITLPELNQMIEDARKVLLELVDLEGDGTYFYQASIDIPPQVNQHALQKLANAGYDLYFKIFYGPAADAQANLLGDRLRQLAQTGKLKIQIFSQKFMLPWGILYLGDDPDNPNPQMFLGLKHIIEHIPLQQNMQVTERTINSQGGLNVSLNVNADIDRDMGRPLIQDQVDYWQKIEQRGGVQLKVRETGDEVMGALGDDTTPDQILYFYCHAISKALGEDGGPDASTLVLTGHQRLTLEKLRRNQRHPLPGAPLVFINACESAELSPLFYDGFVPYFMAKGARGVVGTECETPALFAAEWARRFFRHFLVGKKSLGQIVLDLRQEFYTKHNNLMGLLYALYVDGDTQVVPGVPVE